MAQAGALEVGQGRERLAGAGGGGYGGGKIEENMT